MTARRTARWAAQTALSVLLAGFVYASVHDMLPQSQKLTEGIREVMNRSYNFAGAADWYRSHFAGTPAFLPVWDGSAKQEPAIPVQGKLQTLFSPETPFVTVLLTKDDRARSYRQGWVTDVTTNNRYYQITITYADGKEAIFDQLASKSVNKYDWVYPGDPIGQAADMGQGPAYRLAIRENGVYVDPLDVIRFE
jgi:stage IV sporulation protein FA